MKTKIPNITGSYDNFLQIWKEQTEEEIHRDKRGYQHDHLHLKIVKKEDAESRYIISIFKGRNNATFIEDVEIDLILKDNYWTSQDGRFKITDDTVIMNGIGKIPTQDEEPYHLIKCRYFSGFIEYQKDADAEEMHRMGNLEIHDQGGMVELDIEGVDYTIELTQLVFAHTIELMKIAIYDLPLDEVDINSKAISYAWTSPESKRLGINVRKIISGWTFIEEGFVSSNNMKLEEEG